MSERSEEFRAFYRTHRIGGQKRFYQKRRDEYQTAHQQAMLVRNVLFLLSAATGFLSQLPHGTARGLLGVVAAMFAALAGAVTAFEALIGFPALQKIYDDAWRNLSAAEDEWDGVGEDVAEPVQHVESVLRAENGQWGQLALQQAQELTAEVHVPEHGDAPKSGADS